MTDIAMSEAPASAPAHTPNVDRMVAALLKPPQAGDRGIAGTEEPPAAKAPEAAAETPPAAPVEPEPKKLASTPENARLAEALVKFERSEASRLKLERRVREFETMVAEAAGSPEKALALGKHDPEALIEAMLNGKVKKPAEPELTPEQKAVADIKAELDAIKAERDDIKAKETYRDEMAIISDRIKDDEIASVYPWSADRIRTDFYAEYERTGETPDLDQVIDRFKTGLAGELRSALSTERTFRKLIDSDPKIREMAVKVLGLSPPTAETSNAAQQDNPRATVQAEGPSVITSKMAAEVPERRATETRTRAERNSRAFDILLASKGKK